MVFTYSNVSDSTHTRHDSAVDGIKVQRERGVSQGDLTEMNSVMAAGARGVGVKAGEECRVMGSQGREREVLLAGERHPEHQNPF